MKKKLLAFLMGTSLVLAACGGGTAKDKNEPATNKGGGETTAGAGDAQKMYDQKCSSCHGANLEGTVGPALNKIGSQLSKEDIENVIANGKGAMPKGLLQGDEASAVAEWLAAKK
ncbi:cytochrome c [Cytobacillus depressus]|uniref:Cytochrome c n=1 Tax=Cytobacillus depressus TaxID=1602942 RepID=A0A6L3V8Z0_9BACI|nr:cytochrome c [Cytobacillus depressus]KAB2336805.1 cytochrome c [Cytobacillus depressus]